MKRIVMLLIIAAGTAALIRILPAGGMVARSDPNVDARSAILIDAAKGTVLAEQQPDKPMPPASMSKMMTELVVLERIHDGALSWTDNVTTSEYAAAAPGAQIGFGPGERWTVRDLFEAMTVHSANDAAIALAEKTAGSEPDFVKLMNRKAKAVGLSAQTKFANATGLSRQDLAPFSEAAAAADSMMTARDAARLARHLIRTYPEVLDITTQTGVSLGGRNVQLHTTNEMLPGEAYAFKGNDGLKTGYTAKAGYCFTGTAKRDGRRLIAVVMGAPTSEARFAETEKLFRYGFGKDGSGWISKLKSVF